MASEYAKIDQDKAVLDNIEIVSKYITILPNSVYFTFLQGITPVRNGNHDPVTLEECVKKLQQTYDSIPDSKKRVKRSAYALLQMAQEQYGQVKGN